MYGSFLLGVLLLTTVACTKTTVPDSVAGFYGKLKQKTPYKCCSPRYFTSQFVTQIAYEGEDGLQVENEASVITYDAIDQRVAITMDIGFSNGTRETVTYIDLYEEGIGYEIYNLEGGKYCSEYTLDTAFEENCVSDEAEYVGSFTFGDRVLDANNWYSQESEVVGDVVVDEDRLYGVQDGECVPISMASRFYLGGTDTQLRTATTSFFNFVLGICDESVFAVPETCEMTKDASKFKGRQVHRIGSTIIVTKPKEDH